MPAVSNCPKCDAQVSIPLGAPGETEVRCPLCSEEYLLQEALDKAPPELILVNPPEEGEVPTVAAIVADGDDDDSSGFDFFGDGGELKLEGETPSFSFDDAGSSAASGEGGTATATKPQVRKKRKGPSPTFMIGGIVGGGVLGLIAGYFILLWVFGKDIGREVSPNWAAKNILPAAMLPEAFREENEETVKPANESDSDGEEGNNDSTGGPEGDDPNSPDGAIGTGGDPITDPDNITDPPAPTKPTDSNPFSIDPFPVDPFPKGPPSVDPPKPPAEPKVGLKSPPTFTSNQLGTALAAVKDSAKALEESEKTGSEEFLLKLQLFKDFCALGESYTFAEGKADDGMFQARLAAAVKLARKADDAKLKLDDIGRLAERWLPNGARRDDENGVMLAGTVEDVVNSGDLFKVTVMLAGTERGQAIVLCAEDPKVSQRDEVLILGRIVDAPKDNLHDYTGNESVVVWARAKGFVMAGSTGN